MSGQFLPPEHDRGDANTIGGYMAVHDRPAAFEGSDGFSYSVEVLTEPLSEADAQWGAFIFFVKWARIGAQTPQGHLESAVLATGHTEREARERIGALSLSRVKEVLDELISTAGRDETTRRWWDAMRDEGDA